MEGPIEPRPELRAGEQLHMRAGPGLHGHAEFREKMDEESPDGRPPTEPVRRESRIVFLTFLALVSVAVIAALVWRGGAVPGAIALVLVLAFIGLAAWPAWHAGLDRKIEERHVADEVRGHRHDGTAG